MHRCHPMQLWLGIILWGGIVGALDLNLSKWICFYNRLVPSDGAVHECHEWAKTACYNVFFYFTTTTNFHCVLFQVTGELSNNQEPLRRFMQTFVLAPQTPNKYYVHNDIFRYQDEVFNDSDEEEELEQPHSQHITPQKPNVAPTHIQPGQSLVAPALL